MNVLIYRDRPTLFKDSEFISMLGGRARLLGPINQDLAQLEAELARSKPDAFLLQMGKAVSPEIERFLSRGRSSIHLHGVPLAYVLMHELRRIGLNGTAMESAQAWTIREKLFKIGAVVTVSFRRLRLALSSGYPWQATFAACLRNIQRHYASAPS